MIRFIYTGDKYDRPRELVVENVCRSVSDIIDIPSDIEVEFRAMAQSIYGETILDYRYRNRIRLHEELSHKEVIIPLIHELLHLNQVHTGKLLGRRDGSFVWNNKVYHTPQTLSIHEWSKLPWEIDVAEKEKTLLLEVLNKV